jgi:KipI family sensor histidine kinase inhibitor
VTEHAPTGGVIPSFAPLAESGLLVRLGETIETETNARAVALAEALGREAVPGIVDIVPAYTTVLVGFDPALTDAANVEDAVRSVLPGLGIHSATTRLREIPVHYGGKDGPDLADVAAHVGLPPGEVVTRHAAATYRVACVGFCPGFAFLLGLPPELDTPRRRTPRTRVPTGSVAIGGAQTGVYPMETPGGWNLIGRTNLTLFDPTRPDPFFLRPGDEVRFVPEDGVEESSSRGVEEGERSRREDDAFDVQSGVARDTGSDTGSAVAPFGGSRDGERTVAVLDGGAQATVQDLGRPGLMHLGVSPGGALDRRALVLGNRLLGNDPGSAGVEIALSGPRLRFGAAALAVLTGADLGAALDGTPLPCWQPFAIDPGQALAFTRPARPGSGLRAYLCLDGGVATSPVMDSRSTDLFGRIGGIGGRALRTGDVLPLGPPAEDPASVMRRRLTGPPPAPEDDAGPIRVVLGPQVDRFTAEGVATLLESNWAVSLRSDRMGLRLSGPAISLSAGADTVSEGIAAGSIQVPGDGQPIALLPARQTVGGYPKIAVVIGADLDRLGQLGPNDTLRFAEVSPAEARRLTLEARSAIEARAVVEEAPVRQAGGAASAASGEMSRMADRGDWDSAAVERVVRALAETEATRFRLELGGPPPFTLEWERTTVHQAVGEVDPPRRPVGVERPASSTPSSATAVLTEVIAPLLGIFYRRPGPDRPAYAEEGQQVEDGAVLGLIEVMKTYHEVRAPRAGVVEAFLVEDGATVQFGEPLARLA